MRAIDNRWVREFLDDQNHGLDSLIDYLSFRLVMMRHEHRVCTDVAANVSTEKIAQSTYTRVVGGYLIYTSIVFIFLTDFFPFV